MGKALAIVQAGNSKPTTKKREQILFLERRPSENWFVAKKTPRGKAKWYLRFTITGLYPRLFGPFPSKRKAVLFLDAAHDKLGDFWTDVDDVCRRYSNQGEFEKVNWGPLIEHPLVEKPRAQHEEGGRR